jgi:hypothetical protein
MNTTVNPETVLSTRNLIDVGVQADDVRRRMHGARTTFVRVFEVHVDALPASVPSGTTAGEFRIVGRPATEDAAVAAVDAVAALAEKYAAERKEMSAPTTAFSLADLMALAGSLQSLSKLCRRFHDRHLEAIAEAPIDRLDDPASVVRAALDGGIAVPRMTVHSIPNVVGGTADPRIAIVERARDLQESVGGFRAFAPLPRTMSIATPTTGYDDIKLIALARLVATNIDSIQVDWPLYGPKLAQVALTVGADDVDGIAAVDGGALGTRRSPIEEIKGNIRAAGLEASERDGRFRLLA